MNKIIRWRRIINDVLLPIISGIAVSRIRINCESRVTKSEDIYNTKSNKERTPSNHSF